MRIVIFLLMTVASVNSYGDLAYCYGKVKQIITRDSAEATEVALESSEGTSGYARIGDSTGYSDQQRAQLSMLISAYMAGKEVKLELNTKGFSFENCTNFERGIPVRFVMLF